MVRTETRPGTCPTAIIADGGDDNAPDPGHDRGSHQGIDKQDSWWHIGSGHDHPHARPRIGLKRQRRCGKRLHGHADRRLASVNRSLMSDPTNVRHDDMARRPGGCGPMVPGTNSLSPPANDNPVESAPEVANEKISVGHDRPGNQLPSTKNGNLARPGRHDHPGQRSGLVQLDVNRPVGLDRSRNDGIARRQRQADPQTRDQEKFHWITEGESAPGTCKPARGVGFRITAWDGESSEGLQT